MKKEERYEKAIEAIRRINFGDTSHVYGLWCLLRPEARYFATKLLCVKNDTRLCEIDDIMQESYFAIIKTLQKYKFANYDMGNLYQFIAYYKNEIRAQTREIRAMSRRHDPMKEKSSLDECFADDNEGTILDLLPDPVATMRFEERVRVIYINELRSSLNKLMEYLSEQEKRVIYLRYFQLFSITKTANETSLNERTIIDIEKRALNKMRLHSEEVNLRSFIMD
jgi:RNA polymerase sigma factor, sigma-70 family